MQNDRYGMYDTRGFDVCERSLSRFSKKKELLLKSYYGGITMNKKIGSFGFFWMLSPGKEDGRD